MARALRSAEQRRVDRRAGEPAERAPDDRPERSYRWTCGVDSVLLCGLCLAQPLLVDPARLAASLGWVSPMASFTVVAVQFQLGRWAATAATVAVCTAFVEQ